MWLTLHFDWTHLIERITSMAPKQGGTEVGVEGRGCWVRVLCRRQCVQRSGGQKEHGMFKEIKENQSLAGHIKDFELCPKINRK